MESQIFLIALLACIATSLFYVWNKLLNRNAAELYVDQSALMSDVSELSGYRERQFHAMFRQYCQQERFKQHALFKKLSKCGKVKCQASKLYYGDALLSDREISNKYFSR
eukprot:COSAG01_NODE_1288_length_10887_cov_324.284761_6_plen_110_part_00